MWLKGKEEWRRIMIVHQLVHGGDYNPEQWLEYPDIIEEDIRLMKEAHVNCVSIGIFSWFMLEPKEDQYELGWLEQIINRLYEEDIYVILATPSGAMPHWMTQKYPDVMQVGEDQKRNLPGKRHNFCYTSRTMRERVRKIDEVLAQKFGNHPGVLLWHISNEMGGNFGDSSCHCEECQRAFRNWLKEKYKTVDEVNRAWWNSFWSHNYSDWEEIHSPAKHGENLNHGLNLDWKRFVSEKLTEFCKWEIDAVRKYSKKPVTTNFMDFFKGVNYQNMQKVLDIVSWDNYPFWHASESEIAPAVRAAANHDLMRSLKNAPFLMMESAPSCINWRPFNPMKRPGMHLLSSMQAIAHGSNSVQYFQWRKGRGSFEKFHGAVIGHRNGSDTRVFREVKQVGERLQNLPDDIIGSCNEADIAIVFDWENWWALEDISGVRDDMDYVKEILNHYQAFWEMGITVDFVSMEADLEKYKLVIAPVNYMYKDGYEKKIRSYVRQGGQYVTTYFSGIVNETDLCFLGTHPLEDVLGIVQEEIDAPGESYTNCFFYEGMKFKVGNIREVIHAKDGTEVLSCYEEDYYKGFPVVTRHLFEQGTAYYLAAKMEPDFLKYFYQRLCAENKIYNVFGTMLPAGVSVQVRRSHEKEYVFVMNFCTEPAILKNIGIWKDLDAGSVIDNVLEVPKYGCKVLERTYLRENYVESINSR